MRLVTKKYNKMNNTNSHTIKIIIDSNYIHEPTKSDQRIELSISGDGGIAHMVQAFNAALVASGFVGRIALDEKEKSNI